MIKYLNHILVFSFLIVSSTDAQMIHRYGTTTGNFLEIGVDSEGSAMGDAFVAVSDDISSIYWNPAGLANLNMPKLAFMSQPWIAGINMSFTAGALIIPNLGNIGFGLTIKFVISFYQKF